MEKVAPRRGAGLRAKSVFPSGLRPHGMEVAVCFTEAQLPAAFAVI
jgi:hypothetical protein